ncbi:unnamed protein product [Porites lobata]|uniref:Tesmin/TSO1-like CXC domain-containing protein n=1 Tax=Porites lobata TaxID=104759 RepID=A0ABN8Q8L6_9CNID|nr:unnamed protein product [Porites lobata]
MLFLHAIPGCDTTYRPYSIAKPASLKKYCESVYFQDQAKVFDIPGSTQAEVATAGENALVVLYGGKQGQSLDSLPYRRYYEKVKQWQCLGKGMQFEDRGWKLSGNQVIHVTTDLPAAPESLLKMVRCNCATDCASARCSFLKHGLDCSPACGQCRETACTNISAVLGDSDDEEDE